MTVVLVCGGLFLLGLVLVETILRLLFGDEGPALFDQDAP
jgi:hypothetical protein